MTSTTNALNASSEPTTKISDNVELLTGTGTRTSTAPNADFVYPVVVSPYVKRPPRAKFTSIDQVVEEFGSDAEGAMHLREARQWFANTFHHDSESLRVLRLNKGLSQAELASRIGTTQAHVARVESGHNVQVDTLLKWAEALEVDSELVFRLHVLQMKRAA